jgi:hypothetical protein
MKTPHAILSVTAAVALLSPSLAHARGWQPANGPVKRAPRIESASTDLGVKLYRKGYLLKVGGNTKATGFYLHGKDMRGDVELSLMKPNSWFHVEGGTTFSTNTGDNAHIIAQQLVEKGIGKVVKTLRDGSIIIDTHHATSRY